MELFALFGFLFFLLDACITLCYWAIMAIGYLLYGMIWICLLPFNLAEQVLADPENQKTFASGLRLLGSLFVCVLAAVGWLVIVVPYRILSKIVNSERIRSLSKTLFLHSFELIKELACCVLASEDVTTEHDPERTLKSFAAIKNLIIKRFRIICNAFRGRRGQILCLLKNISSGFLQLLKEIVSLTFSWQVFAKPTSQ